MGQHAVPNVFSFVGQQADKQKPDRCSEKFCRMTEHRLKHTGRQGVQSESAYRKCPPVGLHHIPHQKCPKEKLFYQSHHNYHAEKPQCHKSPEHPSRLVLKDPERIEAATHAQIKKSPQAEWFEPFPLPIQLTKPNQMIRLAMPTSTASPLTRNGNSRYTGQTSPMARQVSRIFSV